MDYSTSHRPLVCVLVLLACVARAQASGSTNASQSIDLVSWHIEQTKHYILIATFILVVSLAKIIYHKLDWLASYVPESLLLIIFGIAAGAIDKYFIETKESIHLSPELFFLVLLPPIMLDSAYRMYNRTFGDIFGIVLILAIFGTVFCFLLIAGSLFGLELIGAMGGKPTPTDGNIMAILLFSSFIVAVDPVAVLAIFKDIGVDKELYYMIFGESLLNDAVTIVLYEIIKRFILLRDETIQAAHVLLGVASFFTVSCGGLLVGVVIGILSSLFTRLKSDSNIHFLTLIMSAYLSYLLADTLKWSGIISIIGCGIVQAAYAFRNIELSTLTTLKEVVELSSGASEALIFVFLGLELFMNELHFHAGFQIWAVVMCIVSRFIVLLVLRGCINYVRVDQRKITWTEFFVTTYGGLRGAVAFSLATLISANLIVKDNADRDSQIRNLFTTTTLLIIFFTVGIMGTTMKPLAKLLRVKTEQKMTLSINDELNSAVIDNVMSVIEVITRQRGRNRYRMFISNLDNQYIRPLLVSHPHDNSSFKILKRYQQITLALHYASTNKESIEQHLADIPRGLWPKPVRRNTKVKIRPSILSNLPRNSFQQPFLDPIIDEAKFTKMLEIAHCNRVKDMLHRKASCITPSEEYTPISGATPSRLKRAFTFLERTNLGYIDDEQENDLKDVAVSKF